MKRMTMNNNSFRYKSKEHCYKIKVVLDRLISDYHETDQNNVSVHIMKYAYHYGSKQKQKIVKEDDDITEESADLLA